MHAQDLVLIANELATNVIRHGGGRGKMWLWCDDRGATCQVSDWGGGMPEPERAGTILADPESVEGRGLWLVRRMSQQHAHQQWPRRDHRHRGRPPTPDPSQSPDSERAR